MLNGNPILIFQPDPVTPARTAHLLRKIETDPALKKALEKFTKPSNNDSSQGNSKSHNSEFYSGFGTESVLEMEKLILSGKIDEAKKMFEQRKKVGLPLQINEAVGDYNGVNAAVEFIENSPDIYPTRESRQKAAEAILFAYPPMLYPGEGGKIMDKVGSKPTNETRVLRLFLANKRFRSLLGCELSHKPAPKECL
jgi:hypothetical protein